MLHTTAAILKKKILLPARMMAGSTGAQWKVSAMQPCVLSWLTTNAKLTGTLILNKF